VYCRSPIADCQLAVVKRSLPPYMTSDELKKRTKQFSLRVLKLVAALPKTVAGRTIGGQVVRSGTSVGANYRAACRGRSKAEFIAKMGTCEEEADEGAYWMEVIIEGELLKPKQVESLLHEAEELTRIFAQSRISATRSLARPRLQKTNRQLAIDNRQ
jgi:four helix bundle protein